MTNEKLKIAVNKPVSERTEIEHLALIKEVHNGSVRDYLLTMGKFKEDKTMEESIQKVVHENPDSIEIGTPGKGGALKVYGDFSKPEEFKKKIENAIEVRKFFDEKIN